MQEYHDGTFGEISKDEDLLRKVLDDADERARTKAIHFGTEEQLEELRRREQSKRDRQKQRRQLRQR